jgi:HEAT repeat protein
MEPAPRKRRLRPRYVVAGLLLILFGVSAAFLFVLVDDPVTRMPPKSAIPANLPPEVRKSIEDLYSADVAVRGQGIDGLFADDLIFGPQALPPESIIPFLVAVLGDVRDPQKPAKPPQPEFSLAYVKATLFPLAIEVEPGQIGWRAAERLALTFDPRAEEALVAVLRQSKNSYASANAARILGDSGGPGDEIEAALVVALADPSRGVRIHAARGFSLNHRGCRAAIPGLVAIWRKNPCPDGDEHHAAIDALGYMDGAPETVEPLISALAIEDCEIRKRAARALRGCRDPRAVRGLIGALEDGYSPVQAEAASSLGATGDPSAVMPLAALLKDPEANVRMSAVKALGELAFASPKDPHVVESLVPALWDSDAKVRLLATVSVSYTKGARATAALLGLVQGTDEKVRWYAARALGEIGDKGAVDPLLEMLKSSAGNQRSVAAFALGLLGDLRAVPPLLDALKDPDDNVRASAADSLGWLDAHEAIEPLQGLRSDPCPEVRAAAARSLGRLGGTWTSPTAAPR